MDSPIAQVPPSAGVSTAKDAPKGTMSGSPNADTTIVHILNWHAIRYEDYVSDRYGGQEDRPDEKTLRAKYEEHIADLEALRAEQYDLLVAMMQSDEGVDAVFCEGLTDQDAFNYSGIIKGVYSGGRTRYERLWFGVAGRLFAEGLVDEVLPLENDVLLLTYCNTRNPGRRLIEMREDEMVRRLVAKGGTVVAIIHGTTDLTDNVERLGRDDVTYKRVATETYLKIVK